MLLKCCSIHKAVIILRHILYLVHICPWLCPGLFMSYLCDLFFIFSFMFFVINHITSFKKMHLLFAFFSEHLTLFLDGGSVRGYKILKYPRLFPKNTVLPQDVFQNTDTETFFCIQSICMYLQATKAKFFQEPTIDKIIILQKCDTSYNI